MLILISVIITGLIFLGLNFLFDKNPDTFLFLENFQSNLMFYILFLGVLFMVFFFINDQKNKYQKNREQHLLGALEKIIDSKKDLLWSHFLSMNFYHSQKQVKKLIDKGIKNQVFYGKLFDNRYSNLYLDLISKKTLSQVNILASNNLMANYKFVEKKDKTKNMLETFIYTSNKDQLKLFKAPFNLLSDRKGQVYAIFDKSKLEKPIIITKADIIDVTIDNGIYHQYQIAELWFSDSNQRISDIKVVSVSLKDGSVYEFVGKDISLEI